MFYILLFTCVSTTSYYIYFSAQFKSSNKKNKNQKLKCGSFVKVIDITCMSRQYRTAKIKNNNIQNKQHNLNANFYKFDKELKIYLTKKLISKMMMKSFLFKIVYQIGVYVN